jgi:hypothetical protein
MVFDVLRDTACSECGEALRRGGWLRFERDRPVCLACADLSHLVYLPRGDAALTKRAMDYSALRAIVVRFSRSRKRYEREGTLVEPAALDRAERECLVEHDIQSRARTRAAERRARLDPGQVQRFAEEIGRQFPRCPPALRTPIAEHARLKYSAPIGRQPGVERFGAEAVELAVRAHIRHAHTRYDALLQGGVERHEARAAVAAKVEEVLRDWRAGST